MTTLEVPLERAALFLDLDGTLAAIEAKPSDVGPDRDRSALLRRAVDALSGRLAILSGRTVEDVDRIADGCSVCVAGVHGLERRNAAGELTSVTPHPSLSEVLDVFEVMARARRGLFVEQKNLSLALHYRGAPDAAEAVRELAEKLAKSTGLVLQGGNMVAELMTPGADKGVALTAFMQEPPFRGATPIFIGDDLTDESGFDAARAAGGTGILVGPPRQTRAQYGLEAPKDVLAWITNGLETRRFVLDDPR